MARVFGLIAGALLVFSCVVVSTSARADVTLPNQGAASALCSSDLAARKAQPSPPYGGREQCYFWSLSGVMSDATCSSVVASNAKYYIGLGPDGGANITAGGYHWCVPLTCDVGSDDPQRDPYAQWKWNYSDGDINCNNGCISRFKMPPGAGIWSMSSPDGSLNASWGNWEKTGGGRCNSATDAQLLKPNYKDVACGNAQASCFDPTHGFCAVTESGEQICTKKGMPGNEPAGCQAGATGAVCNNAGDGTSPPPPPDPPISKGTPPDKTQQATGKDNAGNTYNYSSSSYSGTSPGGSNPDPSQANPVDSGAGGGGTQSNTHGTGNGPAGGSTSGGAAGKGQCADGSVPTASGCSGTYTDTGCDTPPQCFGDAVMCGSARELHAIKCNTKKMADNPASGGSSANIGDPGAALDAAGVPRDGGASGDPDASGLVTVKDLGEDGFDASGLGFSRSCPASPTFNVLGHAYTLDLTPFCNFASLLGWFVLLCAFLVGLRVVATGRA